MSNLLVSILAIALAGVAAITSTVYIGPAFFGGVAAANASRLINDGASIVAAWQNFRAENGGANITDANLGELVAEEHLAEVPALPALKGIPGDQFAVVDGSDMAAGTEYDVVLLPLGTQALDICEEVQADASLGTIPVHNGQNDLTNVLQGRFGCFQEGTTAVVGNTPVADGYVFYYRR